MNSKAKIIKNLTSLLAVALLFTSTVPVNAADETVLTTGENLVPISVDVTSTFELTVPKKITLIKGQSEYFDIKVKGDISGDERLVLKTDASMTLTQSAKEDIEASTSIRKTSFIWSEITGDGATTQMDISPENLTAGKWSGTCTVNVNLTTLPEGYTQLAYIESDSNQYIDTEYILTRTADEMPEYVINCKCEATGTVVARKIHNVYGFGSYASGNELMMTNEGSIGLCVKKDLRVYGSGISSAETSLSFYKKELTINENVYSLYQDPNAATLNNELSVWLFDSNDTECTENADVYPFVGQIYSFSIEKNGVTEVNMIPCIENSTGEIGMYDTVRKQFYGNSGTGAFTYGTLN